MSAARQSGRPIPNSYWVRVGRLAAGEYPGARDPRESAIKVRALLDAGIDHFIDLTQTRDLLEPYEKIARDQARAVGKSVRYERYPVRDMSVPGDAGEMVSILDAIDEALEQGGTVYVHCWGGIGRTGTVIGCWLVRHGLTGDEALGQIAEWWKLVEKRRLHPESPQTREQRDYVRAWAEPADRRQEASGGRGHVRARAGPRRVGEASSRIGGATTRDRFRGCLLGLAVGDALGTTLEFKAPGSFAPIDDMVGGGAVPVDAGPVDR